MRLSEILEALGSLSRTGWMLRGVPPAMAETVAQHLYSSSIIALELAFAALDRGFRVDPYRAAAIALAHDIPEAVVGDITRRAGLGGVKGEAEMRALETLNVSPGLKGLFSEFREGRSVEAYIARIAEDLATLSKAYWYKLRGYNVDDIISGSVERVRRAAREAGLAEVLEEIMPALKPEGLEGG